MTSRRIAAVLAGSLFFTILPGVAASASRGDPGERLWASRYAGPEGDLDNPSDVAVSPDASLVFVTGQSYQGATNVDMATAAYDSASGDEAWFASHDGGRGGYDSAQAVGVSPDGSMIFVTGYGDGGRTNDDFATVAYDAATGQELWFADYDARRLWEAALDLALSPDGSTVFVTGYSDGEATNEDYATVAYDAATGSELWVARYNGPGNDYDYPYALGVSPDGSTVFVTGTSLGGGSPNDFATVAYDATTGSELWVARYGGPGNDFDYPFALGVSPDGSTVIVSGDADGGASEDDYTTVAYDAATGDEMWVALYNGPGNGSDHVFALGVGPDGSTVFVTGRSAGAGSQDDYATVAYDVDTGTELWTARFAGPWWDQATDLGVSPDGSTVFVTGHRRFGQDRIDDYVTVAYDAANGHLIWRSRHGGPEQDWPSALAVSPDGAAVFVTGALFVEDGTIDWGTIALAT